MISNAQSTANSASSTASSAYNLASSASSSASAANSNANSVSSALAAYKQDCKDGKTEINGGCITTGYIDSSCIKTDYLTTAAYSSGWTIQGNSEYPDASYICGNNGAQNNVVLKTGGGVAFACGMSGYSPGSNTTSCGARLQLYHDGQIHCTDITSGYIDCSGIDVGSYGVKVNGAQVITTSTISSYIPTSTNVTLNSSKTSVQYTSYGNITISSCSGYISEGSSGYGNIASTGWVKGKCATLQSQIDSLAAQIAAL